MKSAGKVSLVDLTKDFGNGKGVSGVNLEIQQGEFFVMLGPSGSGKTTTLRIIAGLEKPTSGKVLLDESEITDFPPRNRQMAMVFQNYALYPFLTVRNNIAFPLKKAKVPKDEIERRVQEVAGVLNITDILDRKPDQISGGQRQRTALGRAIIREPSVFLMDEPLSNLDAKLRTHMRAELKRIQRKYMVTTIYVTHDQIEAMTLADRVAVMNESKVVQVGKPMDIYDRPATLFVASFVGDPPINLLDARLVRNGTSVSVEIGGDKFAEVDGRIDAFPEPEKEMDVVVGIRPEDIEPSDTGLGATLSLIQSLGRRRYEHYELQDGGQEIIRATSNLESIEEGTKVKLNARGSRYIVFETSTGKNIYSGY